MQHETCWSCPERRCSEAAKVDVRRRLSSPRRARVAITALGLLTHVITLQNGSAAWWLQGKEAQSTQKAPKVEDISEHPPS
ncbi:MAG: hypothetical protein RLZZ117_2410 [Cyanobacteriota bacterium]